jgi:hypothetical protein
MSTAASQLPPLGFAQDPSADEMAALLDDLSTRRQQGEAQLAPLSFRQLEAMAQRMPAQTVHVRRILLARARQSLMRHEALVQQARAQAQSLASSAIQQQPDQAREAKRLLAVGDLTALAQLGRQRFNKHDSPLAALNKHIEQAAWAGLEPQKRVGVGAYGKVDMKSLRQFKESWARIAAQDELKQAIERGPQNAGPLNSHQLVLRSLSVMQDISPDYLRRFMTHLDALLWLDQLSQRPAAPDGKPAKAASSPANKPKARRPATKP